MRSLKRAAIIVVAGVLVVAAAVGSALAMTFGGLEPSPDGDQLPGGVRLLRGGFSNLYLLPAGDGVALVDCGDDASGASIRAELARRGLSDEAVKAIFLTHGHRDHLGACHLFPKARVYALAREKPLIEGAVVARGPVSRWRAPATDLATHVSDPLYDGEFVRVGDLEARVFHLPGHTSGSAAFLIRGVLFLGDSAAVERGAEHLRPAAWIFSDDQDEAIASLARLARRVLPDASSILAIACGHSGPALSASPLLERAR